jgi:hypothetical protein
MDEMIAAAQEWRVAMDRSFAIMRKGPLPHLYFAIVLFLFDFALLQLFQTQTLRKQCQSKALSLDTPDLYGCAIPLPAP